MGLESRFICTHPRRAAAAQLLCLMNPFDELNDLIDDLRFIFLQEYKACNLEACPEVKRNTPWTPWMPVNVTQGGARQEQRMRYMCRAHLADPHELQIGRRKVETRYCPNDGTAACETDSESEKKNGGGNLEN